MKNKKKSPGLVVNKSHAIRQMAREMVSKGQAPRPKDIVAALRKEGINVISSQVSTALRETGFALRQRAAWDRPLLIPEPMTALSQVSIDDVYKAREFVSSIGSLEKAMSSLVALGTLSKESTEKSPDAEQTSEEVLPGQKSKDIRTHRTFKAEMQKVIENSY